MRLRAWTTTLIGVVFVACKNDPTAVTTPATCAPQATPACTTNDGGAAAPFVPCIQDDCSLATLRAIITAEIRVATLASTKAANPSVHAVAAQSLADFQAQETNLEALEAQLAVAEAPCAESQKAATDLTNDFASLTGLSGPAFDAAFLTSQKIALTDIKQTINFDLIGCAGNGNLKTTLRFDRLRSLDGGTGLTSFDGGAALGVVPNLAAVVALLGDAVDAGVADAASAD